eukprot:2693713-Prymnesium_polylepis.1
MRKKSMLKEKGERAESSKKSERKASVVTDEFEQRVDAAERMARTAQAQAAAAEARAIAAEKREEEMLSLLR